MKIYVMRWQVHMLLPFYTNHLRFYYRMCVGVCLVNSFILFRGGANGRYIQSKFIFAWICVSLLLQLLLLLRFYINFVVFVVGSIMWAFEPNSSRIHIFAAHKKRDKRENWSLKSRALARLFEIPFLPKLSWPPERPFHQRHFV